MSSTFNFNENQPLDALPGHPEYERYPHEARRRFGIREAGAFHRTFQAKVADISVIDHVVADPSRSKVSHIEDYRFVAVMPKIAAHLVDSYEPMDNLAQSDNIVKLRDAPLTNGGAHFEYKKPDGQPYMDARIGVGLSYRERIVALCAGGLVVDGAIITQLQDISRDLEPGESRRNRFSNGLFNGFLWRDTLVSAWHDALQNVTPAVGEQTILVQSARNNPWIAEKTEPDEQGLIYTIGTNIASFERFKRGYDEVAERLGGNLQHPLGDFILPRVFERN
jgi:hypothetical protein